MRKRDIGVLGLAATLIGIMTAGFGPGRPAPQAWRFPKGFLWGTATAAHQVEGDNSNNDWWEWEQNCHLVNCEKSLNAVEHLTRYPEDLDIARDLGMNVYRFSIEWARIEPSEGEFSAEAFAHYRRMIRAVHERGMKVMLTLQHFTLPIWVAHRGDPDNPSWMNPELPDLFARYTERVVRELGSEVDFWITVNEPSVNMLTAYVIGVSPPGVKNIQAGPRVLANFLKAHARAYRIIHNYYPQAKVGFAHHVRVFDPYRSWNPADMGAAALVDNFWNHQIMQAIQTGEINFGVPFLAEHKEPYADYIKGSLDFLGINYYSRDMVAFNPSVPEKFELKIPEGAQTTDVGWEIYPFGLYRVLTAMKEYGYPIYITENGIADAKDKMRERYLCDHLREVARAIEDGADVRAYIHWSLMDNFEWSLGRGPRFGLAEVDYVTQKRTLRKSAHVLKETAEFNVLRGCPRDPQS